jgi:hypothetical protein
MVRDRRGVRQAQMRGAAADPANRAADSWRAVRAVWASARRAVGRPGSRQRFQARDKRDACAEWQARCHEEQCEEYQVNACHVHYSLVYCTGCFGRSGCNDDLPQVVGGGSVGRTVASEVLDAMFLVRRNLAGDWEPAIKGKMGD